MAWGLKPIGAKYFILSNILKGMGYDAAPSQWRGCSEDLRAMKRLVKRGLARQSRPVPWAKHGTYVLVKEREEEVLELVEEWRAHREATRNTTGLT